MGFLKALPHTVALLCNKELLRAVPVAGVLVSCNGGPGNQEAWPLVLELPEICYGQERGPLTRTAQGSHTSVGLNLSRTGHEVKSVVLKAVGGSKTWENRVKII